MDNLFELEDDTVAMVDYESDYDGKDKVKYLNYLTGIANIRRAIEMTQVAMIFEEEKTEMYWAWFEVFFTGTSFRSEGIHEPWKWMGTDSVYIHGIGLL